MGELLISCLNEIRVLLEITSKRSCKSNDGDKPVKIEDSKKNAVEDSVARVITNSDAANRGKEDISTLRRVRLNFVEKVECSNLGYIGSVGVEGGVHGTHVADENINAIGFCF